MVRKIPNANLGIHPAHIGSQPFAFESNPERGLAGEDTQVPGPACLDLALRHGAYPMAACGGHIVQTRLLKPEI